MISTPASWAKTAQPQDADDAPVFIEGSVKWNRTAVDHSHDSATPPPCDRFGDGFFATLNDPLPHDGTSGNGIGSNKITCIKPLPKHVLTDAESAKLRKVAETLARLPPGSGVQGRALIQKAMPRARTGVCPRGTIYEQYVERPPLNFLEGGRWDDWVRFHEYRKLDPAVYAACWANIPFASYCPNGKLDLSSLKCLVSDCSGGLVPLHDAAQEQVAKLRREKRREPNLNVLEQRANDANGCFRCGRGTLDFIMTVRTDALGPPREREFVLCRSGL